MPRRRAARFSQLKATEWDQLVRVKKGEATYEVARPATPEARERFVCGVSPFGLPWDTTANAKNHVKVSITRQAVQIIEALDSTNKYKIFGIEADPANTAPESPEGFYPALCQLSCVANNATRPTTETTSQLTGRKYRKWNTRSGSVPMGRGDKAFVQADNGGLTLASEDLIDFKYQKTSIEKRVKDASTSSTAVKVKSISFDPEIWKPGAGTLPALNTLTEIGTLTF